MPGRRGKSDRHPDGEAAASLQDMGFTQATDLDGGFQAWPAPVCP